MRRRFSLLLLFAVSATLWAVPEPSPEEVEANRRRYERLRPYPEQLARLQRHWQSFEALPAARREQLLTLDHDLHEAPEQARLWNVLERYTDWLEHLPEADQKAVREAPDKAARLTLIGELRDREWMKGQSRSVRDQWAQLKGRDRADYVKKLRQEERQRRLEWLIAGRFWRELDSRQPLPGKLKDLPPDVQVYVNEYLRPMLENAEKERLDKSEGIPPDFMLTLVELADRHPPALRGAEGPRSFQELPAAVKKMVVPKKKEDEPTIPKVLRAAQGQWPGFAIAVVEFLGEAKRERALPHELWAHKYQYLTEPMQKFITEVLQPVLDLDEKAQLLHSEGKWPGYPEMIQKLARAHHLQPPWHTLPDAHAGWDPAPYRLRQEPRLHGYPEVARLRLRQFALYELDPAERAKLNLSQFDPASIQRLTEAYFNRHKEALKKSRQAEPAKGRKPALEAP